MSAPSLADPYSRGLDYLYQMRSLAIDPELISIVHDPTHRIPVCIWIAQHIQSVNERLNVCLQACHDCFHPWQQRRMQIFAAPFADGFGIDGLCNLQTDPITLLVDVGRVVQDDWLALVAHEYAHAHLGSPGHQVEFVRVLTHLCLGLGLNLPDSYSDCEVHWRSLPALRRTLHPLHFWLGHSSALLNS